MLATLSSHIMSLTSSMLSQPMLSRVSSLDVPPPSLALSRKTSVEEGFALPLSRQVSVEVAPAPAPPPTVPPPTVAVSADAFFSILPESYFNFEEDEHVRREQEPLRTEEEESLLFPGLLDEPAVPLQPSVAEEDEEDMGDLRSLFDDIEFLDTPVTYAPAPAVIPEAVEVTVPVPEVVAPAPDPMSALTNLPSDFEFYIGRCDVCFEEERQIPLWHCGNEIKATGLPCAPSFCATCLFNHFHVSLSDMKGYVSALKCPCCFGPVAFQQWQRITDLVDTEIAQQYFTMAQNICSIRCPNCHETMVFLPRFASSDLTELRQRVALRHNKRKAEEFEKVVQEFASHKMNISTFVTALKVYFHDGFTLSWAIDKLLRTISDPERTVALQLAKMRMFGGIVALPCLCSSMCYYCHTRAENHTVCGSRFEQEENSLGIQPCPQCSVMIVKSEGCNYVTCVCGMSMCFGCGSDYNNCQCY
eukprot:GILI01001190.1.p1 GENE.GILI01001190.1~~GILI01001190.1.p1  ORF type:complete len:474 (+),score=137.91 GILI01001190.1:72-1493(+)